MNKNCKNKNMFTGKAKDIDGEIFRQFAENSGQPFGMASLEGTIYYANPALLKLLEKEREDLIGKSFIPYYPEELREKMEKEVIPTVIKEGRWEGELALITGSKKKIYTFESFFLIKGENGEPLYIGDTINDITEKKALLENVDYQMRQLLALFDSINEVIYVTDPITYEIIFVNKYFREIIGRDPLGDLCYRAFQGLDSPCDFCTNHIILEDMDSPYQWEYYNPGLDRTFMITDRIIKWPDNRNVRFELAIDITKIKEVEERLLKKTSLLESINSIFREAIICKTEEDVAKKCLFVAEKLTESKFGFIGEVNEKGTFDTIAISDPGWGACRVEKTNAVKLINNMVIRGLWGAVIKEEKSFIINEPESHPESKGIPEGHPPLTSFLGIPLKESGKVTGMIALGNKKEGYNEADRDDMESLSVAFVEALNRKRAEELLEKHRQNLEELVEERTEELKRSLEDISCSNKELEQFAYVASHDLQEPLRKISSFTGLLSKKYKNKLDEKADKYMWYIVDGANRMQSLIHDLLMYSRAGRGELVAEPVDMNNVMEQVISDLQPSIRKNKVKVTSGSFPVVGGNSSQLQQVLRNLISNSIKFKSDREIEIYIDCEEKENNECLFSVKDNGIGIEEQYLERIFGIFQRLHIKSEYPGTGIGLSICRKIIERHNGRIWVSSDYGKGTTVFFTLPLRTE